MNKGLVKELPNGKVAIHPGYYINEIIEEAHLTQKEFAKRVELSQKLISQLLSGDASITSNTAKSLSLFNGTSVQLWLNLQSQYDARLSEYENEEFIKKQIDVIDDVSYSDIAKLGVVGSTRQKQEQVRNLLKTFSITNLNTMYHLYNDPIKNRLDELNKKEMLNSNIWIEISRSRGLLPNKSFNKEILRSKIDSIFGMHISYKNSYALFKNLKKELHSAGVGFIIVPTFSHNRIRSMILWQGRKKEEVLIALSNILTEKYDFWQELIQNFNCLLNDKRENQFHLMDEGQNMNLDDYLLIKQANYDDFIRKGDFTSENINAFVEKNEISTSIMAKKLYEAKLIEEKQYQALTESYSFNEILA